VDAQAEFQVVSATWAAFNRDDVGDALSRIREDAVAIPFGAAMEGKRYEGHDGIRDWFRNEIRVNWEQFDTIPDDYRKVGDRLVVYGRWQARGRDSGIALDVPATWVVEFCDGQIAFWQTFTDRQEAHEFAGLRE
jgi:ketosteroid isomerase-like protein